jgi:hypothetical protein
MSGRNLKIRRHEQREVVAQNRSHRLDPTGRINNDEHQAKKGL